MTYRAIISESAEIITVGTLPWGYRLNSEPSLAFCRISRACRDASVRVRANSGLQQKQQTTLFITNEYINRQRGTVKEHNGAIVDMLRQR